MRTGDPEDMGADEGAAFLEQWKVENISVSKLGWYVLF
jgi:hypothetical protein